MDKEYAILNLELVETITAYQFASMIGTIEGLYTTFLYLDYAENNRYQVMPPYIEPETDENLYLKRVDVGTPNYIELIGYAEPLYNAIVFCWNHWQDIGSISKTVTEVVTATGAIVGGANDVLDLIGKLKGEKAEKEDNSKFEVLESKLKNVENELQYFRANGKIDESTYQAKPAYIKYAKTGSRDIITNVKYTLVKN